MTREASATLTQNANSRSCGRLRSEPTVRAQYDHPCEPGTPARRVEPRVHRADQRKRDRERVCDPKKRARESAAQQCVRVGEKDVEDRNEETEPPHAVGVAARIGRRHEVVRDENDRRHEREPRFDAMRMGRRDGDAPDAPHDEERERRQCKKAAIAEQTKRHVPCEVAEGCVWQGAAGEVAAVGEVRSRIVEEARL